MRLAPAWWMAFSQALNHLANVLDGAFQNGFELGRKRLGGGAEHCRGIEHGVVQFAGKILAFGVAPVHV